MANVWKEYPLEFGGYKFSEHEAAEIVEQYRRRCIAECIAEQYVVNTARALRLADMALEYLNDYNDMTEDEVIERVATIAGLEAA